MSRCCRNHCPDCGASTCHREAVATIVREHDGERYRRDVCDDHLARDVERLDAWPGPAPYWIERKTGART